MPADVRPYLTPLDGTVSWEPWMVRDGIAWAPLPEAIDGWDPSTDLHLAMTVRIHPERMLQETGLHLTDLAAVASWTSSTSRMTDAAPSVPFSSDGTARLEPRLVGQRLSGTLTIRTTVSLTRTPGATVGVAFIPGSVLAEQQQRVVLETQSAMFAIHEIDFANTRLSPNASWHLESRTDLDMPFYGTFRILINKRDSELSSAAARGAKDRRQQALLDELEAGVTATLLELAIDLRTELAGQEWPIDSIGDVLGRILDASGLADVTLPTAPDLPDFRTHVAGAIRAMGRGRLFT